MNIALIHPSRGRAQMAIDTAKKWLNTQSGNHTIHHILIIDGDDPACIQYDTLLLENPQINRLTAIGCNDVVTATNIGAKEAYEKYKADILIYLSDDFNRPPQGWDQMIVNKVAAHFLIDWDDKILAAKPWLLKVNDGVKDPKSPVLTIPIMSRALYEHLGNNFWWPEYKSMWCDVDLYFTCKPYIIEAMDILFQHDHPTWCGNGKPNDDTYNRSALNWNQGARVFNRRKREFGWQWDDARILDTQP